jgi:hypothetical protein
MKVLIIKKALLVIHRFVQIIPWGMRENQNFPSREFFCYFSQATWVILCISHGQTMVLEALKCGPKIASKNRHFLRKSKFQKKKISRMSPSK